MQAVLGALVAREIATLLCDDIERTQGVANIWERNKEHRDL